MSVESPIDWEEMFDYLPGTLVELKQQPGHLFEIAAYDATLVPPIWLVGDPRPRYPQELTVISRQCARVCQLDCATV